MCERSNVFCSLMLNMRKIFQITGLIFIVNINVISQEVAFGIQIGLGTYSMPDLKKINENASSDLPFNNKIVSDFPPYFYYRSTFLLKYDILNLGLIHSFQSTGSRISAKDYSGKYSFDMIVNSNSPGLILKTKIEPQSIGRLSAYMYILTGPSFSKLKISEYLSMADTVLIKDKYNFKALNFYFEPGIEFIFSVKNFNVGFSFGYLIQAGDEALYMNNKKDVLYNTRSDKPAKAEWNGFRFGIYIYYNLTNKKD